MRAMGHSEIPLPDPFALLEAPREAPRDLLGQVRSVTHAVVSSRVLHECLKNLMNIAFEQHRLLGGIKWV